MIEHLHELLAKLRERFPPETHPAEVEAYLSSEGYDRGQIGEILALLFTRPANGGLAPARSGAVVFRVLGPHERGRFAADAWGHLLALRSTGSLTAPELEYLIDRLLTHVDGPIALSDLRALLESVGFEEADASADHTTVH